MSKDIFMVDYSSCEQTNREVKSNVNYIDSILGIIDDMDNYVSEVSNEFWNRGSYDIFTCELEAYLNQERTRYDKFHSSFSDFYSPIESSDKKLVGLINSAFDYVKNNKDYEIYVKTIQMDLDEESQEDENEKLISMGLSEEDAMKISVFTSGEMADLLSELSKLDDDGLKIKIDELKNKTTKTPAELLLIDILCVKQGPTYGYLAANILTDINAGKWTPLLAQAILGRSAVQYDKDIKSLDGLIYQAKEKIAARKSGQKSIEIPVEKLEKLENIRNSRMSNLDKFKDIKEEFEVPTEKSLLENLKSGKFPVGKALNIGVLAYQAIEVGKDNCEDYSKYGTEEDDAIVNAVIDEVGVGATFATCAMATEVGAEWGAGLGTAIAPVLGTAIGFGAGALAGGAFALGYGYFIGPALKETYQNDIEPKIEIAHDKINDIGDWGDTLSW